MSVWDQLTAEIAAFMNDIRRWPVAQLASPRVLRAELTARYKFDEPMPLEQVTAEVLDLLRTYTVHATHPRYFGLFNPSVHEAGIVADAIVALYNPQLASWMRAPAA